MLKRTSVCTRTVCWTLCCVAALALAGCAPDPALKKGEVIDRGVHSTATPIQTTPENHPNAGPAVAPANPK